MSGPRVLERAIGPGGTSITYTGVTAEGHVRSSTYSWLDRDLARKHMAASEADFRQRLATPRECVRHLAGRGRPQVWLLTGLDRRRWPTVQRTQTLPGETRGLLIAWGQAALAVSMGRK